jgi:hypothetical protein
VLYMAVVTGVQHNPVLRTVYHGHLVAEKPAEVTLAARMRSSRCPQRRCDERPPLVPKLTANCPSTRLLSVPLSGECHDCEREFVRNFPNVLAVLPGPQKKGSGFEGP